MAKVKTCIKEGRGKVALADVELRKPGPGEALIRTTLTTICGSDLHLVDGMDRIPAGTPQGHEAVGVIEAVGDGVHAFRPGDRVVAACVSGCGHCVPCLRGDLQLCTTYMAPFNILFGCQSEAFLVRSADVNLAKIPSDLRDHHAIFAADILSTAFAAVERGQLQRGQTVAIYAQGPVGLCATAAAKHLGASRIFAVEAVPERIAMAKRFGADEVISPERAPERILELTSGQGVDLAIEAVGKPEAFAACLRSIRAGGTVSIVGVYAGVDALALPITPAFLHATIVTSFCPGGTARLQRLMSLMQSGALDLTPMFTHASPLADIASAYELFRTRLHGAIKVAITP